VLEAKVTSRKPVVLYPLDSPFTL
ncbi:hypothetical protein CCACVL1_06826, partial [Corchorus capsularis]